MRVGTELFIARDFENRLLSDEIDFDVTWNDVALGVTVFTADVGDGYSVEVTRTDSLDSTSVVISLRGSWEDRPSFPNSMTILAGTETVTARSNQRGVPAGPVSLSGDTESLFRALNDVAKASDGAPFAFDAKNYLGIAVSAPGRSF